MNSSLLTADVNTHLKMVIVALLAFFLVLWIGVGARMATEHGALPSSRLELPLYGPSPPGLRAHPSFA